MAPEVPSAPRRIQLRRVKGWRMPANTVKVARPTKWGNPFTVAMALEIGFADDDAAARKLVVECFRSWLTKGESSEWWFLNGADAYDFMAWHIADLRGKNLACFCRLDQPCHGDVLLEVSNV